MSLFSRTASLDYLNHLNTKYNLKFEPLRAHFCVLPGGLKFMKILHEIIMLILRELVNRYRIESEVPFITALYLKQHSEDLNTLSDKAIELKKYE